MLVTSLFSDGADLSLYIVYKPTNLSTNIYIYIYIKIAENKIMARVYVYKKYLVLPFGKRI